MSTEIQTLAKEPKRERGKQRVAALMDAGAELFAEKGYEATTMTEIASRAGAAIGSLYQFFPSKEALAEALFNRFAERAAASFAQVEARAPGCSARELADLLIDYKLDAGERSGRGDRALGRGRGHCRAPETAWRRAARTDRRDPQRRQPGARPG